MPINVIGDSEVCRWKGGRAGAFSVGGDDCLRSQLLFAIPEMDKRGICGTWWVNPGRGGWVNYKNQDDAWAHCWIALNELWKAAANRGHDFGNHTMHHLGAASLQEAEYEIGETARIIWQTNPRQRLQLFMRGGGVNWPISEENIAHLLAKYSCALEGRGGGCECPTWETDPSADELCAHVEAAIREGSWHYTAFHGIGPLCEWGGPVSAQAFIGLLDRLVHLRKQVWSGTFTEVYKYQQERSSARIQLLDLDEKQARLSLSCACDRRLYDYPLTLRTCIPDSWNRVRVYQADFLTEAPVVDGVATYEAIPGSIEIIIEPITTKRV